jgi:hypothetical protein
MLRVAHRKDRRTATGETTSHLTKLANYANKVIGYALVDAALKNSSKSGVAKRQTKAHPGFSLFFALPQLRSLRCASVFKK